MPPEHPLVPLDPGFIGKECRYFIGLKADMVQYETFHQWPHM